MQIDQIVNLSIGLSATPASVATFNVPLLLIDHADIPIDLRYLITSRSAYATDFTASTTHVAWCASLWGQNYNPAQAYVGRWVSSASNPHFIASQAVTTLATWTAVTDGCCTVTTTAGADILTSLDFSSATSWADVALVFDTAIVAGGLSGARCAIDSQDRMVFTDAAVTGSGSDTVVISASGAGTDVVASGYLNVANGFQVGGLDAEALETALSAILARDNTPFIICQRGGSISQVTALCTAVESMSKYFLFVSNDTDAKDGAATTDVGYIVGRVGSARKKTHLEYTEHTADYPDAAVCGEVFQKTEATCNVAFTPLGGVSESGLAGDAVTVIPLTDTERAALEVKGYDYLIRPSSLTHFRHGLSAAGTNYEVRIMIGKMYMEAKVNEEVYGYMIANDVVTFSDSDIAAIKGIIDRWANIMVERKVIEAGYEIVMPAASDFTAAAKATHTMTLSDLSDMETQRSVNDITITLTWGV
jgi:hypothetical protein